MKELGERCGNAIIFMYVQFSANVAETSNMDSLRGTDLEHRPFDDSLPIKTLSLPTDKADASAAGRYAEGCYR